MSIKGTLRLRVIHEKLLPVPKPLRGWLGLYPPGWGEPISEYFSMLPFLESGGRLVRYAIRPSFLRQPYELFDSAKNLRFQSEQVPSPCELQYAMFS